MPTKPLLYRRESGIMALINGAGQRPAAMILKEDPPMKSIIATTAAPAAIGAFSEDPKAFGKALIFVALGEGVALYGLLISILIINKL